MSLYLVFIFFQERKQPCRLLICGQFIQTTPIWQVVLTLAEQLAAAADAGRRNISWSRQMIQRVALGCTSYVKACHLAS